MPPKQPTKKTSEITIKANELRKAFNNTYRWVGNSENEKRKPFTPKMWDEIKTQPKFVGLRGYSAKTINDRLLPKSVDEYPIKKEDFLKKLLKVIFAIAEYYLDNLETESYNGIIIPSINRDDKFIVSVKNFLQETPKEKNESNYRLFYYTEKKTIGIGYIFITSRRFETRMNREIETGGTATVYFYGSAGPIKELKAEYEIDDYTVYYRLERKENNKRFPFSQFSFKLSKEKNHNFHIGVFTTATSKYGLPYSGTIIAITNVPINNTVINTIKTIDEELFSLITYILRRKSLQENIPSLNYQQGIDKIAKTEIDRYPSRAKIWYKLKEGEFFGSWICYFMDPYEKVFLRCYMQVNLDGTLFFYTHLKKTDPYSGALKTIIRADMKDSLIINFDFIEEAEEYRVRIFINTKAWENLMYPQPGFATLSGTLVGTYSCMRLGTDKPYCSKFCMRKIMPLNHEEICKKLSKINPASEDLLEVLSPEEKLDTKEVYQLIYDKLRKTELIEYFWPKNKKKENVSMESFLSYNTIYLNL